jgi:hypothetical protein
VNDLERWAQGPGIIPSGEQRRHKKAMEEIVHDVKEAALKVDALAALTAHIMEDAMDLDDYRVALANGDPTKNAVLMRIELGFVAKAERVQRNFGTGF